MPNEALRLHVDSPYPGESMSSFLGRTAQFYGTNILTLVGEILEPRQWDPHHRECWRDWDFHPPPALDQVMAQSVQGWISPLADHKGFEHWTLAQRRRDAYCPLCFQEDLRANRTPYFRMDWSPVLVTMCWRHRSPLFQWPETTPLGLRRLPKAWLYRMDMTLASTPAFMQEHLATLNRLRGSSTDYAVAESLACLWVLQEGAEKQSMTPSFGRDDFGEKLKTAVKMLTHLGASHLKRQKDPPIASLANLPRLEGLFESAPRSLVRRSWEQSDEGIQQTPNLSWRCTYLLFVAMTLQRSPAFGHLFPTPRGPHTTWRAWWQANTHHKLDLRGKERLSLGKMRIGPILDGTSPQSKISSQACLKGALMENPLVSNYTLS